MVDLPIVPSLAQAKLDLQNKVSNPQEAAKAQEFEAVFLSQFVDQMMKTVDTAAATGGPDGDMWRSFMSDAISQSLVDRGGLGLAQNIESMLSAYRRGAS